MLLSKMKEVGKVFLATNSSYNYTNVSVMRDTQGHLGGALGETEATQDTVRGRWELEPASGCVSRGAVEGATAHQVSQPLCPCILG